MSSAQHFVLHFTDEGPTVLTMVTVFCKGILWVGCLLLTGNRGKRGDDHTKDGDQGESGMSKGDPLERIGTLA